MQSRKDVCFLRAFVPKMTATEHHQANVIFIDVDRKKTRPQVTPRRILKLLGDTITDVVRKMDPSMIRTCELGR